MGKTFPKEAFWSTWIFFAGIAVVVVLGAFENLRPTFVVEGGTERLSMNLVIRWRCWSRAPSSCLPAR
jgi:anaerobic C4-dicarboxylate transporter DcuB